MDKPEWAFANIQDVVYEHTAFIADYLQPLTNRSGFKDVDVKVGYLGPHVLTAVRVHYASLPHFTAIPAHQDPPSSVTACVTGTYCVSDSLV